MLTWNCRFFFRDNGSFAISAIFRRPDRRRHGFQLDNKGGALVFAWALNANFAAVRIHHCFGNGQSQSQTAKATGDGSLSLLECIKDFVDLIWLNPNSVVSDANLNFVWERVRSRDRDATRLRCKFDAVLNQVPEHLLQPRRIAFDVGALSVQVELRFDGFSRHVFAANFIGSSQNFVDINYFECELQLAFGDARNVQQIVDESGFQFHVAPNYFQRLAQFR